MGNPVEERVTLYVAQLYYISIFEIPPKLGFPKHGLQHYMGRQKKKRNGRTYTPKTTQPASLIFYFLFFKKKKDPRFGVFRLFWDFDLREQKFSKQNF